MKSGYTVSERGDFKVVYNMVGTRLSTINCEFSIITVHFLIHLHGIVSVCSIVLSSVSFFFFFKKKWGVLNLSGRLKHDDLLLTIPLDKEALILYSYTTACPTILLFIHN